MTAKPQREVVGSDASARFDYQKTWAFCELLDRHLRGDDYLVAFEFHDDVVFFDSEVSPTAAQFYQVKTQRAAQKKTATLLTRKGAANSILGKMYLNFDGIASAMSLTVSIVSNIPYEFSATTIALSAVEKKHAAKIKSRLAAELPNWDETNATKVFFCVFNVGIDEIDDYLRGKAVAVFAQKFGPDYTASVMGWLELVRGEVRRKNNFLSDKVTSVADLVAKKCVGRSFILQTLELVQQSHNPAIQFAGVADELRHAGWAFDKVKRLEKRLPTVVADYKDPNNYACRDMATATRKAFDANAASCENLATAITVALSAMTALAPDHPYDDSSYQGALAVLIWHERL